AGAHGGGAPRSGAALGHRGRGRDHRQGARDPAPYGTGGLAVDPSSPAADLTALYIQEIGALLFGMVFFFLYRQSKVVYFGLWSIAWLLRLLASFFGYELLSTHHAGWLAPYATFEFAVAIVLISVARAVLARRRRVLSTVLRL